MMGMATTVAGQTSHPDLERLFHHPPASARPWVFWYWLHAAVSKEGIAADLKAMHDAGIGGAYLMPIEDTTANVPFSPPVRQLTPAFWSLAKYAMQEADHYGIALAIHDCDGFAVAGGPWITPALSMQKVTWTETYITGGRLFDDTLLRPVANENYYEDIRVYAYPTLKGAAASAPADVAPAFGAKAGVAPVVTTDKPGANAAVLALPGNKDAFTSDQPCWIQYAYAAPFTCRSIVINTGGNNYEAERLLLEASDDGTNFHEVTRLKPPRSGWDDADAPLTYAIPATTARFFRFVYDKEGSEPGAEDLDAAKWKPSLKLRGITLKSAPSIDQYEGKSGVVWRISPPTTAEQAPDSVCVARDKIIDLTRFMRPDGKLVWNAPPGEWTILRMGHTSTGHTNATGGGGKGLECDKFNPAAVRLQYDNWFGAFERVAGPGLAARVIKVFHVDSWECGSQNWSPVFAAEFKRRRGYDLLPYLPVMAGIPVQSAAVSERVLLDVRRTINDLVNDNFFGTMAALAHRQGCQFSSESVAPVFTSDGISHHKEVDIPMGEFWLRSPTHDKPNDVLDAVSGGHIYGKRIIGSEAFTELRLQWDESPSMLKPLQDRNYALGVNRLVYHVFMHNPWMDRKPGMTLDGVGTFLQRDQTWWKQAGAWVDYTTRCQALLQVGEPITDIAIFTGEDLPSRAVLPDRLTRILPGLLDDTLRYKDSLRMANAGVPLVKTLGVQHVAGIADPVDWVNPLHGYAYDSFNRDALFLATVKNGRIVLPGGASYAVLVLPGALSMQPDTTLSAAAARKVAELEAQGAHIVRGGTSFTMPVSRDLIARAPNIAYTHRKAGDEDIYFVSNQSDKGATLNVSLRVTGKTPELWDPVTGEMAVAGDWKVKNGRTELAVQLDAFGSVFVVFRKRAIGAMALPVFEQPLDSPWTVIFDTTGVVFDQLQDWSQNPNPSIRYYSGTAEYTQTFNWDRKSQRAWLDLGKVANIATVYVNGINCGIAWTSPYKVEITKALRSGRNQIRLEVTNTWANRIIGDHDLAPAKPVAWTTAPYRLSGKLLPAGLLGPVKIEGPR